MNNNLPTNNISKRVTGCRVFLYNFIIICCDNKVICKNLYVKNFSFLNYLICYSCSRVFIDTGNL